MGTLNWTMSCGGRSLQLVAYVGNVSGVATLRALVHAGGTGGRAGSGGGRTRGRSGYQGDGRIDGQGGQNLLPIIVAQVGNQGRGQGVGRNQNGDAVNDHIWGDAGNTTEGLVPSLSKPRRKKIESMCKALPTNLEKIVAATSAIDKDHPKGWPFAVTLVMKPLEMGQ
ncbi:hypothetical protein Tco_0640584 [Tanacetum coccineum]